MHKIGVMGRNVVLVHMVHVADREIKLLAQTNTNVIHCPTTTLKLNYELSSKGRFPEMLEHGVNVAIGPAWRARARGRRSRFRSRMLFGQGRDLREQPDEGRDGSDDLRLSGERVPPLCVARALDSHGERQLLHRHDLS